jgi:hypothetical protein
MSRGVSLELVGEGGADSGMGEGWACDGWGDGEMGWVKEGLVRCTPQGREDNTRHIIGLPPRRLSSISQLHVPVLATKCPNVSWILRPRPSCLPSQSNSCSIAATMSTRLDHVPSDSRFKYSLFFSQVASVSSHLFSASVSSHIYFASVLPIYSPPTLGHSSNIFDEDSHEKQDCAPWGP